MDDPEFERHNIVETAVETMMKYVPNQPIPAPADHDLTKAHIIDKPAFRQIDDLTENHRRAAEYLKPARRKGTAQLCDLQSLIAWTNRFKGENSVLFAKPDLAAPRLTCVADYHLEGPAQIDVQTGDPSARHCHHRAIYDFPLSDEWKAWMAVSGEMLDKDEMGEFIEANAKDVFDPTPNILAGKKKEKEIQTWEQRLIDTAAQIEGRYGQLTQLLQMSRQFQVYETSDLKLVSNRDTGEGEIQFLNEHKTADGKPLKVPNLIIIAIPVFRGGAPYRMPVRFRYRKRGSSVGFILSIYNPEKAFEAAFDEALKEAEEETKLPLFLGSPEQ